MCRLCSARIGTDDCIELRVPRGVHFFLQAEERADDTPFVLRITTCRYCGHVQSLDEPVIYEKLAVSATYVSAPLIAARQAQAERTLAYATAHPRRILEIGCGDGAFLATLGEPGRALVGIEPSALNAAAAAARGITVQRTVLTEDMRLAQGPFDAFFAFHVLEHVPDVRAFLRGIRDNLRDGAVGCIEVPSSEAAYEQARFGHFMTDHLSYFFAGTLRVALEAAGFEIIALGREWEGEHLTAYVRTRSACAHHPVPGWVNQTSEKLATFLRDAVARNRKVAFWGASNAILPVLMHLPSELPYVVVDKAATKHGRFAPGSHVPIFDTARLKRDRIDYVVVTAARFFDEIVSELRAGIDADVETLIVDVGVATRVCRLRWPSESP